MNYIEAIKEMKIGKKVRRPEFAKGIYWEKVSCSGGLIKSNSPKDDFDCYNFEATDWEVYEEIDKWNLREYATVHPESGEDVYEEYNVHILMEKIFTDILLITNIKPISTREIRTILEKRFNGEDV